MDFPQCYRYLILPEMDKSSVKMPKEKDGFTRLLNSLSERYGISTAEVLRNAVGLFCEALAEAEKGKKISYIDLEPIKLPPGWSFLIGNPSKRSDGERRGRWIWKLYDQNNYFVKESEWWGFDTMQEAMTDLANCLKEFNP